MIANADGGLGTRTNTDNLKKYVTISQKIDNDGDGGGVVTMTGPPAYLADDCEAAKPSMSRVDEGGNTLSNKNEEPVWIPRLPWRIPSMAMSILNNDHNNNNADDNDDDDNNDDNSGGGISDRTTKARVVGYDKWIANGPRGRKTGT